MAVTITNKIPQQGVSVGGLKARVVNVALATNDYLTGGVAVSAASVNLNEIYGAIVVGQDGTAVGYLPVWDAANAKVLLFQSIDPASAGGANTPLVQVSNAVSVAVTVRLYVLGV